jgi:hypothetical protein
MEDLNRPTDNGTHDHEAGMARGQLYNSIKNAMALFDMIQPGDNLEGWVAAKITKAADYLNTVHDHLSYEKTHSTSDVGETQTSFDFDNYTESLRDKLDKNLVEQTIKNKIK